MSIQSITYASAERTALRVVTDIGVITLPWPCRTWHRELIEAWLAAGNEIDAFDLPAPACLHRLPHFRLGRRSGRPGSGIGSRHTSLRLPNRSGTLGNMFCGSKGIIRR